MNDSISRQAAIDALNDEFTITGKTNAIVVQDYIRRVNNRLRDLPSAQPERKKGKWETEIRTIRGARIPFFACSECGKNSADEYRYCPNCGARMEGEEG